MTVADLLDSRLVMVTGKGGTGKTTYAAALGVLGAARGRRTIVCEVDSQLSSLDPIFRVDLDFEPRKVHDDLWACNVTWLESLQAYLQGTLPMKRLVRLVLENRLISRFFDITPGARELVILSRLGDLLDEFDLVVVDMPASGHAYSLLDILRTLMALFRSGPVRKRAQEIRRILHDPGTRLAFVALPEEMVVNETIETLQKMRRGELLGGDPVLFLNEATLPSLTDDERELIARLDGAELGPLQREFVRAGVWEDRLEQATAEAQVRLRDAFGSEPVLLPPAGAGGQPREVVGKVAVNLGRYAGVSRRELSWT